jgi:hypothetical protein
MRLDRPSEAAAAACWLDLTVPMPCPRAQTRDAAVEVAVFVRSAQVSSELGSWHWLWLP